LSLIAPPTAKKRRTIKKVLIEVKFPLSWSQYYSLLINLALCDFRLEFSSPQLQNLPMLHPLVWPLLLFPQRSTLAFTLNLVLAEETMVDQLVDVPVSQHASTSRDELPAQIEISSSSGTQSPPAQTETPTSPEMNSLQAETPILQGFNPLLARQKPQP
jgi:hypothetical protein